MPPLKLALIGAGNRGAHAYAQYALQHPDKAQIVAVAEPIKARREPFATKHEIPSEHVFPTWEALLNRPQLADAMIIATPDSAHVGPTLAALHGGYDVLLEKPMATTLENCVALAQAADDHNRVLMIAHVLRYSPFFMTLQQIVQSGRLGDIVTIEHRENVAYFHMAHSYVRGNWRNKAESSPMILSKSCHDLDILYWMLGGETFTRLSSMGSLRHYRPENAPRPDVPQRCTDGCPVEAECPFSAPAIYLENKPFGKSTQYGRWPMTTIADGDVSREALQNALESGPYGRCVYHCDNDVVDHQIVLMETDAGTSVAFTMHGHSHVEGRTMRYDGTRATLLGNFVHGKQSITIHDHLTGDVEHIPIAQADDGHGGGDVRLMDTFVRVINGSQQDALTNARASLESHLLAFAAEQARIEGSVIDLAHYRAAAFS